MGRMESSLSHSILYMNYRKRGFQTSPTNMKHKLIIIGSGPAGLTAAIYAARANLEPIVIAGIEWGGQLMKTTEVENFPGFPDGISGPELMQNMMNQAQKFGAKMIFDNAVEIEVSGETKTVKTGSETFESHALIIATGSKPKLLGIPGENEFYGRGVSTCATCDAAFYRDRVVAVVGGGDSAMEEATFLTKFANKVYLIHRSETFRASPIMAERAIKNEKIEILYNTELKEVVGDNTVEKLKIYNNKENVNSELDVNGVFLAIGHIPSTEFVKGKIELDDHGFAVQQNDVETSIPGLFVAGEIQDQYYRQAITTAGDGCKAALVAQKWLVDKE